MTKASSAVAKSNFDESEDTPNFSKLKPAPGSENLTNFADVKSRMNWTPERRQLLQTMWDRGDKVPAIAAALGCKPAAISVARARFGLKPRRMVSGRPKHEPDEPAHKIDRVAFATSRLAEFCSVKELVAQTGHESHNWLRVIVKELVDNGIDACEEAETAPVIKVTIATGKKGEPTRLIVEDNGPGIGPDTVKGIIDYNIRISSREAYVSPTRGRQGNALKTILPMAFVLGGKVSGETCIEARGWKHQLIFGVNAIRLEPIVRHVRSRSRFSTGTRVTIFWPGDETIYTPEIAQLLNAFAWVNPHLALTFIVDGETLLQSQATNKSWTKYRACDATSAHWYSVEQLERHAGAMIDRDQRSKRGRQKTTVREFIAQFRGMSSTEKQKDVLHELGAAHLSLHRFFGTESEVNHGRMKRLLDLLRQQTRPVRPEALGVVGEEHFRRYCVAVGGEPKSFKYFISPGQDSGGRPYVVEIATCAYQSWVSGKAQQPGRYLVTGVNFSATLENPFNTFRGMEGLEEILADLRAGSNAPIIVAVHYASPHIEYLDRGKSRIGLE
jgi:DNA topoisomerase VI subunit B